MGGKRLVSLLVVTAMLVVLGTSTWGAVIRVRPDGNDVNDGSTWSQAKRTVQAGLSAAASGDEVWVAAGIYVEQITLTAGVGLYGGFVGIETSRDQRDWQGNVTVLDGAQRGGRVVTAPPGATAATVVDGFTIQNAGGTGSSGSGIYCRSSSPVIAHNTITGNEGGSGSYGCGAGIYCEYSSATISNNTISGNRNASQGGGIWCSGSSPTIMNNRISANNAASGGGIYCDSSSPLIANNTIAANRATHGGGICCAGSYSSPTIASNVIVSNTAVKGAGVYCAGSHLSATIANNTITENTAGYGGGVFCGNYSEGGSVQSLPTISWLSTPRGFTTSTPLRCSSSTASTILAATTTRGCRLEWVISR